MSNTVLLKGKGLGPALFFLALLEQFPDARLTQPKLKWWQSTTRHELRLQNLTADEILHLEIGLNVDWPLTSLIKIEVF